MRTAKIQYCPKTSKWTVIEKQMLDNMKLHKVIVFKNAQRCKVLDYCTDNKIKIVQSFK